MGEKQRGKDKGKKKVVTTPAADSTTVTKGSTKAAKVGKLSGPVVRVCPAKCRHEYQDKKYGPGMRVFNPSKKGSMMRCTVCNRETGL